MHTDHYLKQTTSHLGTASQTLSDIKYAVETNTIYSADTLKQAGGTTLENYDAGTTGSKATLICGVRNDASSMVSFSDASKKYSPLAVDNQGKIHTTNAQLNNLSFTDAGTGTVPSGTTKVLYTVPLLQGNNPTYPVGKTATFTGAADAWTQRITIANDDALLTQIKNADTNIQNYTSSMRNTLYDYRLNSLSNVFSTGVSMISCQIYPAYYLGAQGVTAGGMLNSQGWMGNTNIGAYWGLGAISTANNSGAHTLIKVVAWKGITASVENFSLPWDNMKFGFSSVNDTNSAGSHMRQFQFEYWDNTWTLQSVIVNAADTTTTFNVRRIKSITAASFGANLFNDGSFYLWNQSTSLLCEWVDAMSNSLIRHFIVIPKNGWIALRNINVTGLTTWWRILLLKQTSSTVINWTVLWQNYQNGSQVSTYDLSELDVIYGPTVNSENWGVAAVSLSTGAANPSSGKLTAVVYQP